MHDLKIHMYLCSVGKAWRSLIHPKEMVGIKLCLKTSYIPPAPTDFFLQQSCYILSYKLFCFSRKPNEAVKKVAQLDERFLEVAHQI